MVGKMSLEVKALPHGIFQKFLENVLQWSRNVREDGFCVAINNKTWSYTICVFTDLPAKQKNSFEDAYYNNYHRTQ